MEGDAVFCNATLNKTEDFDPFCATLLVGPVVWGIFSLPCACLGVPASVWLLWVLIQRQRIGLTNDIYMLNLTIMDLIYNIFKLPVLINFFAWQDLLILKMSRVLEGFSLNGRPLLMACVCVDCYMAVVFPIPYMKMKHSRYRMVVCAFVWGFMLAFGLYFAFAEGVLFIVGGIPRVFPIITIAFCDVSILYALRKPDPSGRSDVHPQKQRALQSITNSFIMTLVSYLPLLLVQMFFEMIPLGEQEMLCHVQRPALIFSMLGTTILPLLYLGNLGCLKDLTRCVCVQGL